MKISMASAYSRILCLPLKIMFIEIFLEISIYD